MLYNQNERKTSKKPKNCFHFLNHDLELGCTDFFTVAKKEKGITLLLQQTSMFIHLPQLTLDYLCGEFWVVKFIPGVNINHFENQ